MADIRLLITVAAPPDKVYLLVSTAAGFAQWWAEDSVEVEPRDGRISLGFFDRATIYRLRPDIARPDGEARFVCETGGEWEDTTIGFRLEAAGAGTRIWFTHLGWRDATEYFLSCTTTWGELMFRLKAAAQGTPRGPLFSRAGMNG